MPMILTKFCVTATKKIVLTPINFYKWGFVVPP